MGKGKKIHEAKMALKKGAKPKPPSKPPPPPLALAVVKSFLAKYELKSLLKALKRDLRKNAREGWNLQVLQKQSDLGLTIEKLVEDWQTAQKSTNESTGSSDSEEGIAEASEPYINVGGADSARAKKRQRDESTSGSDSDVQMDDLPASKTSKTRKRKVSPWSSSSSSSASSSSSSSSSESDADDESDLAAPEKKSTAMTKKGQTAVKPPEAAVEARSLKRRADSSSSGSSSDESESSGEHRPAKRTKIQTIEVKAVVESSSDSSSASSSSEEEQSKPAAPEDDSTSDSSDSDSSEPKASKIVPAVLPVDKLGSESSGTVIGDKQDSVEMGSSSDDNYTVTVVQQVTIPKKKHGGAKPTPLAELSALATNDGLISNEYRQYEYAERAYNNLSVTRGAAFTKAKNKGKRGSYRGGAIDTAGGKGFKFED